MRRILLTIFLITLTFSVFSQQTDTIVCQDCLRESLTTNPKLWRFTYCFYKNDSNPYLNKKNKLLFADNTHQIKLYEANYIDSVYYESYYYINGQKAKEEQLDLRSHQTQNEIIYDYNGDTISGNNQKMYNYKGERIPAYFRQEKPLDRFFFQAGTSYDFYDDPNNLLKIMISKSNKVFYPHNPGYWEGKDSSDIDLELLKLDSLSKEYKSVTTVLIYLDTQYNQDSILQNKLNALAKLPNLKEICLYGNGFKHIPNEIYLCKNLEVLELIGTDIITISSQIKKLKNLRSFALLWSNNFMYDAAFKHLSKLPQINSILLQYNLNEPLPKELVRMKKLKVLDLGSEESSYKGKEYTEFTQTQKENLDLLCELKQVKYLAATQTSDQQIDYIINLILQKKLNYIWLFDSLYKELDIMSEPMQ